jgi:hypothetical protein
MAVSHTISRAHARYFRGNFISLSHVAAYIYIYIYIYDPMTHKQYDMTSLSTV